MAGKGRMSDLIYSSGIIDLQALYATKEERGEQYTELYNAVQEAKESNPLAGTFIGTDMLRAADRNHGLEPIRINRDIASSIWNMIPGESKRELEASGITPRNSNIEIYRMPLTKSVSVDMGDRKAYYCPLNLYEVNVSSDKSENTYKVHIVSDDGHGSPVSDTYDSIITVVNDINQENQLRVDLNEVYRQYENGNSPFTRFRDPDGDKYEVVNEIIGNDNGINRAIDTALLPSLNELIDQTTDIVDGRQGQVEESRLALTELNIIRNVLKSEIEDKQDDINKTYGIYKEISGYARDIDELEKRKEDDVTEEIDKLDEQLDDLISRLDIDSEREDVDEKRDEINKKEEKNEAETITRESAIDDQGKKSDKNEPEKDLVNAEIIDEPDLTEKSTGIKSDKLDAIKEKMELISNYAKGELTDRTISLLKEYKEIKSDDENIISKIDEYEEKRVSSDISVGLKPTIERFESNKRYIDLAKSSADSVASSQNIETGKFSRAKQVIGEIVLATSWMTNMRHGMDQERIVKDKIAPLEEIKEFIDGVKGRIEDKIGSYKIELDETDPNAEYGTKTDFEKEESARYLESDIDSFTPANAAGALLYDVMKVAYENVNGDINALKERIIDANILTVENIEADEKSDGTLESMVENQYDPQDDPENQNVDTTKNNSTATHNSTNDKDKDHKIFTTPKINEDAVISFENKDKVRQDGVVKSIIECNQKLTSIEQKIPPHLLRNNTVYLAIKEEMFTACVEYRKMGGKIGKGEFLERNVSELEVKEMHRMVYKSDVKETYRVMGGLGYSLKEVDQMISDSVYSIDGGRIGYKIAFGVFRPLIVASYHLGARLEKKYRSNYEDKFENLGRDQKSDVEGRTEDENENSDLVKDEGDSKVIIENTDNEKSDDDITKGNKDEPDKEKDSVEHTTNSDEDSVEDKNVDVTEDNNIYADEQDDEEELAPWDYYEAEDKSTNDSTDEYEQDTDSDMISEDNTQSHDNADAEVDKEEDQNDNDEAVNDAENDVESVADEDQVEEENSDDIDRDKDEYESVDEEEDEIVDNDDQGDEIEQDNVDIETDDTDIDDTEPLQEDKIDDEGDQDDEIDNEESEDDTASDQKDIIGSDADDEDDVENPWDYYNPLNESSQNIENDSADAIDDVDAEKKEKNTMIPADDYDFDQHYESNTDTADNDEGLDSERDKTQNDSEYEGEVDGDVDLLVDPNEVADKIDQLIDDMKEHYAEGYFREEDGFLDINAFIDISRDVADVINNSDTSAIPNVNDFMDSLAEGLMAGDNAIDKNDVGEIITLIYDYVEVDQVEERIEWDPYIFIKNDDGNFHLVNPKTSDQSDADMESIMTMWEGLTDRFGDNLDLVETTINIIDQMTTDAVNDISSPITDENAGEYSRALQDGAMLALADKIHEMDSTSLALYGEAPSDMYKSQSNDMHSDWNDPTSQLFGGQHEAYDANDDLRQQALYDVASDLAEQAKDYADDIMINDSVDNDVFDNTQNDIDINENLELFDDWEE